MFDSVPKLVLYAFEHICNRCKKQMTFSGMQEFRKFYRWDPTLTFSFLVEDGRDDLNITKSGPSSAH